MLVALCVLIAAAPGKANVLVEPTFEEKMAESELVFIGTVMAIDRGGRHGAGSTATLLVMRTLKGESRNTVVVSTYHPVSELNPRCCEIGATYIMFLRPSARDGQPVSIWGVFGMVRIGGPPGQTQVLR